MDIHLSINAWAILVSTVVYFFLGALWYSPVLFAKPWVKYMDWDEDHEPKPSPWLFVASFILELITVISLAIFISALGISSWLHGLIIGLAVGCGFILTSAGSTGLFSNTPQPLFWINQGYHVVALAIAGAVLGVW